MIARAWIAAILLAAAACASGQTGPLPVTVVRVIDGDTLVVLPAPHEPLLDEDNARLRIVVRLLGVDAPELRADHECEREAARRATEFVRRLLAEARDIRLVPGPLDRYGRTLGRITADGRDLGHALIEAGLARPYKGGRRKPWC
jgi:endonuclease YncB( thermonuclease family)